MPHPGRHFGWGESGDMSREPEDETVERMLQRYREGLLTKEELDDFLELQRHRSEVREKAIQAGRMPGRALEEE